MKYETNEDYVRDKNLAVGIIMGMIQEGKKYNSNDDDPSLETCFDTKKLYNDLNFILDILLQSKFWNANYNDVSY